jgi:hypothetical protein
MIIMEVKDFIWDLDIVSWSYNEKNIKIQFSNINFANVDSVKNYVYIVCGENFSEDQVYYLSFEGKQIFAYDKKSGKISWDYKDRLVEINCKNITSAKLESKDGIVLVISGSQNSNEKLLGFTLDGVQLFEKAPPKGYHFLYFSSVSNRLSIVCEGGKDQADAYGRNNWHFVIDTKIGEMVKSNLAY